MLLFIGFEGFLDFQVKPNCDQVGTKWDQVGTKSDQSGTKWDQMRTKWDQVGTKWHQVGTKRDQVRTNSEHVDFLLVLKGFLEHQMHQTQKCRFFIGFRRFFGIPKPKKFKKYWFLMQKWVMTPRAGTACQDWGGLKWLT